MSYSHVYFQGNITRYMSILLLVLKSSMVFSLELNTHDRTAIILSVTTSSYVCFPSSSVVKNLPVLQETWVTSLDQEDPLEEEMATHSSILVWEIPWTEEPSWLPSMGLQKSQT